MRSYLARWYPAGLALIAAIASLAVLNRLPEQMPVHFDMHGNANGWMPRAIGAFLPPALILFLWALLHVAPRIDPRRANYEKFGEAWEITIGAVLGLIFAIHFVVLALALGYPVPMQRVFPVLIGTVFVVMGNVLPRARSNFMYGIRTPWTLSSDRVWARTHRLAGYTMALAGLVMIAAGLLRPAAFTGPLVVGISIAALAGPALYSYVLWKQEQSS